MKYAAYTLLAILILLSAASAYFIDFALCNSPRLHTMEQKWDSMYKWYPTIIPWADSVRQGGIHQQWLTNHDGHHIRLYTIPATRPTQRTAVLAHGYKDNAIGMMHLAYMYHHIMGCNVVLYDQYAHGQSSGSMIQMGWLDRENLILCARRATREFGDSIILHGISMGGATVMMASAHDSLPTSVRAIVDDCGYTSVWDEYVGELRNQFGLPPFPILHFTNLATRLFLGWDFTQASSLQAVSRTTVPMLFIHGDSDDFVPTSMVHTLYAAHHGRKSLWLSPGSIHALSYHDHPQQYTTRVRTFLGW